MQERGSYVPEGGSILAKSTHLAMIIEINGEGLVSKRYVLECVCTTLWLQEFVDSNDELLRARSKKLVWLVFEAGIRNIYRECRTSGGGINGISYHNQCWP